MCRSKRDLAWDVIAIAATSFSLFVLHRKVTSLSPSTRQQLIAALYDTINRLCTILANASSQNSSSVSQSFRDALAAHVYFLYNLMFIQETALGKEHVSEDGNSSKQKESNDRNDCVKAMLLAAKHMADYRNILWQRGVPDEAVVNLPCRIAYVLLEKAKGVVARRAACADQAIQIIALSVNTYESLHTAVSAALMDLMHNQEHMAAIAAEICSQTSDQLPIELLRETGRLDGSAKASGVKFVAPFIEELAKLNPKLVLNNMSAVLPQLECEPYNLRSAIVAAIAQICSSPDLETEGTVDTSKARNQLLDILFERVYDTSSFTRSAALKAWIQLVQDGKLPKDRVIPTTKLAMDRLQDKTVIVRKQSMQLLTSMLENNPYMGNLDPKPYRAKLRELYDFITSNVPENIKEALEASLTDAEDDAEAVEELKLATLQTVIAEVSEWNEEELSENQKEYAGKVQALKFTQSALDFIELFSGAEKALESMLLSANTSDVTEALRFFVRARHFQLPCAVAGMKLALSLMWASEQSVRDEVLKAFVSVFLEDSNGEFLPNQQIAKNLIVLTGNASVSEKASIEEAIMRLVKAESIPADVFLIFWSIASKGSSDARAAALELLAMGASADRTIVDSKSRLRLLLEAGFGDYMKDRRDWRIAGAAAVALQRIERAKVDPSDAKYLVLERIMEELCLVACGDICQDEDEKDTLTWFSAAEEAIKAIFVISPEPEALCSSVIKAMYESTFVHDNHETHPFRLARFFHVIGQISISLLVYTESLSSCVRRATAKKTLKKQEEADNAKVARKSADSNGNDAIEAELGVAAEAEAENERKLADISENEILGRGLISVFAPLVSRVIVNEGGQFSCDVLMQSSTLALCKFMCVSRSFCEKHLPLLFTALANVPEDDTVMRANTVVALGDLAFRFPNEVEPYTPRLYACLRDVSTKVRRHTLMVLTHLILNDMVKVKGQVCEIAMCLQDDDPRIRDLSRLLFHELSKRSNNPVYNLLPDIISQLSLLSLPKEDFRAIMNFLLGHIKKERQMEQLTEKLCQRFPKATSLHQKSDLAHCLTQLKMTERSIKCLSDNFKLYKDCLFDEDIRKSFSSIVSKAKKFMKPEMKQFLDEWEEKLDKLAELGAENEKAGEKAERAKKKASKRSARQKQKQLAAIVEDDVEFAEDKENHVGETIAVA